MLILNGRFGDREQRPRCWISDTTGRANRINNKEGKQIRIGIDKMCPVNSWTTTWRGIGPSLQNDWYCLSVLQYGDVIGQDQSTLISTGSMVIDKNALNQIESVQKCRRAVCYWSTLMPGTAGQHFRPDSQTRKSLILKRLAADQARYDWDYINYRVRDWLEA